MTAIVHDESACILPSIIKLILLGELLRIRRKSKIIRSYYCGSSFSNISADWRGQSVTF